MVNISEPISDSSKALLVGCFEDLTLILMLLHKYLKLDDYTFGGLWDIGGGGLIFIFSWKRLNMI